MAISTDKEKLRKYLERECPHYLGAEVISMNHVREFKFSLFERGEGGEVSVYRITLSNNKEAFGTAGGLLPEKPYLNVFPTEDAPNAKAAAALHLYFEGVNRFETFRKMRGGLKKLADILKIPEKFRVKE